MYCMKCGRAIADDQVFCSACARVPVSAAPVQVPRKEVRTKPKKEPKAKKAKPVMNFKVVAGVLAIALCISSGITVLSFSLIRKEMAAYDLRSERLRQQEAAVKLREQEADNRDQQIAELEQKVAELEARLEAQQ